MKNSGNEIEAINENEHRQEKIFISKTGDINSSKVNQESGKNAVSKKIKYDKLWVPKNSITSTNSKIKSTPRASGTRLNCLKRSRESKTGNEIRKNTESKSLSDSVPIVQRKDASTQTLGHLTADVDTFCVCKVEDKSTGSNVPIQYRCSAKSIQTIEQSGQRIVTKSELHNTESRDSWNHEKILLPVRKDRRLTIEPETSWANENDLIYEEESHPRDELFLDKPKYVTTCESFGQSTDKSSSISHNYFDAAVGSSIIIEANKKNASTVTEKSHHETIPNFVDCEVCTACRESHHAPGIFERTRKPSQFECSSCIDNYETSDNRNRKRHSFATSSRKSDENSDDFIRNPQNISESIIPKSNCCKDTREKSAHRERSSGERRTSRSSRDYRTSNESLNFWHDNVKSRKNNEPRISRPLNESSKMSLESINDFHRETSTFPGSRGSKPRNKEINKLFTSLPRSNKKYNREREINDRTLDLEEFIPRRKHKSRNQDQLHSWDHENPKKCQIIDKMEPLFKRNSENSLTLDTEPYEKSTYQKNQYPKLWSACKFSEINNFGKIYDWDRPMDMIVDQILSCQTSRGRKSWKSGNESMPRNKCYCHN